MATTIRFRDHEEFQRAALHMAIAGSLAGMTTLVLSSVIPAFGPLVGPWSTAALLAAAAFGASPPRTRTHLRDLILLGTVTLAAAALALSTAAASSATSSLAIAPSLSSAVLAAAFGILIARTGRRFAATLLVAAAVLLLSRYVHTNLLGAAFRAGLPSGSPPDSQAEPLPSSGSSVFCRATSTSSPIASPPPTPPAPAS